MVLLSHAVGGFFLSLKLTEGRPVLRFLSDGKVAVYLFFFVSGFALTEATARYAWKKGIWPLICKRYIRLCAPVFLAVFFAYALLRLGWMHNRTQETSDWLRSFYNFPPNFFKALFDGVFGVLFLQNDKYNPILWSIRPEFICSVLLYFFFFKKEILVRRWVRFGRAVKNILRVLLALALVAALFFNPLLFCFAVGVMLSLQEKKHPNVSGEVGRNCLGVALFLFGALGSAFWQVGYKHAPTPALYALLLFLGTYTSPWLQNLFSTRVAQFLGAVSFPLYLIHFPIVCALEPLIWQQAVAGRFGSAIDPVLLTSAIIVLVAFLAAMIFRPLEEWVLKKLYAALLPR